MSAQEVYHQFIYQLRSSNLNFVLSETPYSAQILLRILQGLRVAQAAVTERWPGKAEKLPKKEFFLVKK